MSAFPAYGSAPCKQNDMFMFLLMMMMGGMPGMMPGNDMFMWMMLMMMMGGSPMGMGMASAPM